MKTNYKSVLGVKEAISEGYEYYGEPGHEFQTLQDLSDLTKEDLEKKDYVLFDKEQIVVSVSKETIIDACVDEARDCIGFCDDTESIDDRVRLAVDWEYVTKQVNDALSGCNYRSLTDIKLVWP